LVGVAVKFTVVPAQIVVEAVLILTEGATTALMVMVMLFEIALSGVAQAALEVKRQVITSLLASVVELNEAELVPTTVPFLLHW
jgi:hypothetical protein